MTIRSVTVDATAPTRSFRLTAFVLCHDLRCHLPVEAVVASPHAPTVGDAADLLRGVAEERLIHYSGEEGHRYELIGVNVAEIKPLAAQDGRE